MGNDFSNQNHGSRTVGNTRIRLLSQSDRLWARPSAHECTTIALFCDEPRKNQVPTATSEPARVALSGPRCFNRAMRTLTRSARVWIAVATWLGAAAAYAQSTTGTISGRVVDAQGLAVPGVTITVTSPNLQGT